MYETTYLSCHVTPGEGWEDKSDLDIVPVQLSLLLASSHRVGGISNICHLGIGKIVSNSHWKIYLVAPRVRSSLNALLLGRILHHGQDDQAQTSADHVILHLAREPFCSETNHSMLSKNENSQKIIGPLPGPERQGHWVGCGTKASSFLGFEAFFEAWRKTMIFGRRLSSLSSSPTPEHHSLKNKLSDWHLALTCWCWSTCKQKNLTKTVAQVACSQSQERTKGANNWQAIRLEPNLTTDSGNS